MQCQYQAYSLIPRLSCVGVLKQGYLNMVSKCQLSVLLPESKRAEAAVQRTFTFGEAASFIVQH